ncbi:hypothetical protein [Actinokineospora iranica]|uniref:Uncharacterized protein n=1 Tax=Actinokineospora iranica TaxID=1271860 RepID=A0A1G6TLL4_9PSEU|nr:hypothetical protein [Actinokineospora iranica]SDD30082.1 hypothetical protein SAMN05216174_109212 [Actinokineospora iranica]
MIDEPDSFSPRQGGTGDINGDNNVNLTGSHGRVWRGDIHIGLDALDRLAERVPPRRPVSANRLELLDKRFVPPSGPGFAQAQERLRNPGTVVISGQPGSGRLAAGLMLLHRSGQGDVSSFQELTVTEGQLDPDPRTIQEQERLLLDLTGYGHSQLSDIKNAVEIFRAEVEQRAYLVVVVSADQQRAWGTDFGRVLTIGCPERAAVLRRHLEVEGIALPDKAWFTPGLAHYLHSGRMSEIAELADQVRAARDRALSAEPGNWLADALNALADQRGAARNRVTALRDGRDKALLFTAAMLDGASVDEVFDSEARLLTVAKYPHSGSHSLDEKDFTQRLDDLRLKVDAHGVRIAELGLDAALRTYFWTSMPGLRTAFRNWVASVVASQKVTGPHKRQIVERFAEQALAVGEKEHIVLLVHQWTRENLRAKNRDNYRILAEILLHFGLTHEQRGQEFRRQFYDWAKNPSTATPLARIMVPLCETVIAPTFADQAVVRLRHLAGHGDEEVRSAAANALLRLAGVAHFWRRILYRLCPTEDSDHFPAPDRLLFAGLAAPELLLRVRAVLGHSQVRRQLTTCWRLILADPLDWTPELVTRWLSAKNPVLRRILVDAAAPDPALLGYLYGIGRRWQAAATPAEDAERVVNDLRTAVDRALDLTFLSPEARPEETGR